MPFDAKQSEILNDHFSGRSLTCPSCLRQTWQLVEIITLPVQGTNLLTNPVLAAALLKSQHEVPVYTVGKALAGKEELGLPVAIIACTTCFFLMTFAWRPIVDEYLRRTRDGQKI